MNIMSEQMKADAVKLQPMNTAPKDGTEVLVLGSVGTRKKPGWFLAHYMPGGHCIEDHPPISEGWYYDHGDYNAFVSKPIGWIPAPVAECPDPPPDETRGLYDKFKVERTDGSSEPGRKHAGCRYFVLDIDHDEYAYPALRAYAMACQQEYPKLAADLKRLSGAWAPEAIYESMAERLGYLMSNSSNKTVSVDGKKYTLIDWQLIDSEIRAHKDTAGRIKIWNKERVGKK